MTSGEQPTTHTFPICRETSAAWLDAPPNAVRMPTAAAMPRRSSGEVSRRTRTTFAFGSF